MFELLSCLGSRIVEECDDLEIRAKEIGCKALAVEEAWDPVGGGAVNQLTWELTCLDHKSCDQGR